MVNKPKVTIDYDEYVRLVGPKKKGVLRAAYDWFDETTFFGYHPNMFWKIVLWIAWPMFLFYGIHGGSL